MKILFVLLFVLSMLLGCAQKTALDRLFENNFEGVSLPAVKKIKEYGINKSFPYTTFDRVWDSVITISIQQGIVVRISKETGTIFTVTVDGIPLIIFVERAESIIVYLVCMCRLDQAVYNPKTIKPKAKPDFEKRAKDFFDKLATQVYAEDKWKFLYKTEKSEP